MDDKELMIMARSILANSYSPYSRLSVGAAIRTQSGKIFFGTNIENCSYSLSMCAERVALFKAVSEGHKSFTDLAITSSKGLIFPCGACRQVLYEFSSNLKIHLEGKGKAIILLDLLPYAFKNQKSITEEAHNSDCK